MAQVGAVVALALVLAVAAGDVRAGAAAQVADLVWDALADCESGGDWQADTGNGYYGGLQIRTSTWEDADGLRFADRPDHAGRREQTTVGEEIVRRQGWEAWPSCARELGLIGGDSGGGAGAGVGGRPVGQVRGS
ncbi:MULTISPECIES: transglycosylase family protein [Streptomyces]|uniref:transglycosylase family protein n=1 Tax=Streptomyces TaxID=1883 RepID=UPI001F44EF5E|nr:MULTISPECIES: transglycosylase family protein [Streptomyces]